MSAANPPASTPSASSMSPSSSMSELFERAGIVRALAIMAIPTTISQMITLIYNIADTWFIGRTNNPYMVAASSLSATVFMTIIVLSNFFGVGGGNQVVLLLGAKKPEAAARVASWSLMMAGVSSLAISLACWLLMNPLLGLLGASSETLDYAAEHLFYVVILGALPTVLSNTMSFLLRNTGHAREAAFGLSLGGVLNIALDPLFMFVLLPPGHEVSGAAIATLLSNIAAFLYYVYVYRRLKNSSILRLPHRFERISPAQRRAVFAVGIPAGLSLLFYNLTNVVINKLSAAHGDIELAAIGIILKVERLPLNIGIGICLGMMPLIAYNYGSGNHRRMHAFFSAARTAGLTVAAVCVLLYWVLAPELMHLFIEDTRTVELGTRFLRARCFAPPFMFLSFHMVHFMQAIERGSISFNLALIRQLCLNIPILLLFNLLFGMSGIIWTQAIADLLNVLISYLIYARIMRQLRLTRSTQTQH